MSTLSSTRGSPRAILMATCLRPGQQKYPICIARGLSVETKVKVDITRLEIASHDLTTIVLGLCLFSVGLYPLHNHGHPRAPLLLRRAWPHSCVMNLRIQVTVTRKPEISLSLRLFGYNAPISVSLSRHNRTDVFFHWTPPNRAVLLKLTGGPVSYLPSLTLIFSGESTYQPEC